MWAYIEATAQKTDYVSLAIVLDKGFRHIGNPKIGPINCAHGFAANGLVIGDKDCGGKGYAIEAIALATRYAFDVLGMHRLEAGVYATNIGSAEALRQAGWSEERC